MAYFSNGSEGMDYEGHWCCRCVNQREDDLGHGCRVWDLHMIGNYDQCKDTEIGKLWKTVLSHFIPMREDGLFADKCRMFIEKPDAGCIGQAQFEFRQSI